MPQLDIYTLVYPSIMVWFFIVVIFPLILYPWVVSVWISGKLRLKLLKFSFSSSSLTLN